MSFDGKRPPVPDLENGTFHVGGEEPTNGEHAGEPPTNDESDNNDKFWKLYLDEAISEAKWKVSIGQTELDSLLVFAGLFAAVVSAFLVDLRAHLRPGPEVIAIAQIASILRNDTGPVDVARSSIPILTAGYLWYGSLVVTLVGALWAVLAKGWLGEILRETPNNPADRALERWRRDKAAKSWHLENVITAVPLLIQIGLALFLSGFVVQSFDDNHGIGLEVLVYVVFGIFAYAVFTFLPWFCPDCPYRTPLTYFLHLVPKNFTPWAAPVDASVDSKIQILASRLNRSSNDDIFCSAASVLNVKLESHNSKKWYEGVEQQASAIAEAFAVRLRSFAHRVQTTAMPSPSTHASISGASGESFTSTLYSPIEQGIACLSVLQKSIEASLSSGRDKTRKSPWIMQDIDHHWRSPEIFPATWRLLSLSIHITRLVATQDDYKGHDIAAIDWEHVIGKTFSNLTLRSILGASACRGLLLGKENLKRVCALGLATFMETEATTPTDLQKLILSDKIKDLAVAKGKVLTVSLWHELEDISKNSVVHLLRQTHNDRDEETSFEKLLDQELYESEMKASISEIIADQLDSENGNTRKQAVWILTKFAEHDKFQGALESSSAIPKVIAKLNDSDKDVRTAAIEALLTFSKQGTTSFMTMIKTENAFSKLITILADRESDVRAAAVAALLALKDHESYEFDIKASIPAIIKQLDDKSWGTREKTIQIVRELSELEVFRVVMSIEGAIPHLITTLADGDPDVRAAAAEALIAFNEHEWYRPDIKSSIPIMIKQLDASSWSIRENTIKMLTKLSEFEPFQEIISISRFVSKLEDTDSDVRAAAATAVLKLTTQPCKEFYLSDIKLSIPTIIKQLDDGNWATKREAIRLLAGLSDYDAFQETINENGVITKLVEKLEDHGSWIIRQEAIHALTRLSNHVAFHETLKVNGAVTKLIARLTDEDEDVRASAVKASLTLATQSYFEETLKSVNFVANLFNILSDDDDRTRAAALQAMSTLSIHEVYGNNVKSLISVSALVEQLQDESWNIRQHAVQTLAQFSTNVNFQHAIHTENTLSILVEKLSDDDQDVRAAAAEAMSVFGVQELYQKLLKSKKIIIKLTALMSDPVGRVRRAARASLLTLSSQYQNGIKIVIPAIMNQLEDKHWATRQQTVHMLATLSEQPAFQETMKTEMFVAKLVARLEDHDGDVRTAAAQALLALGTKGLFLDRMKAEKAVPKLITKLTDRHSEVHSAVCDAFLALGTQEDVTEFLQTVVSTLHTVDSPVRKEVYRLLNMLKVSKDEDSFLKEIDAAICDLLTRMKDKDLPFIRRAIVILTEITDADLIGDELKTASSTNKPTRDSVEQVVQTKLVYDKNSPRSDVVLALSRLATNDVFLRYMKPAIPGLIEAVSSSDWNVWSVAAGIIATLSTKDEYRPDLVPAIPKLIQQLGGWEWDDDNEYPLDLIEVMYDLARYKEFQNRLKHAAPILMKQLQKDVCDNAFHQENGKNKIAFYKASFKLISRLCQIDAVGRDLVPLLTPVLANMDVSLTNDLFDLVSQLIQPARLTMNDRIALVSSLRLISPAKVPLEVHACKLNIAALLTPIRKLEHTDVFTKDDYISFVGVVMGNNDSTVKSTLSTLFPVEASGVSK